MKNTGNERLSRDASVSRLNAVVYTPIDVANALTRRALEFCNKDNPQILEPSAGDGAFLKSLKELGGVPECDITAVDICEKATASLQANFPKSTIITSDFLKFSSESNYPAFDLILGNPPFIRKSNFSDSFKKEMELLCETFSYPSTQLKNAWAAFTLAASRMLSENGVLAFVVPYELMTVNYGQYLQSTVLSTFDQVEIFVPDEKAFRSIDQDAVAFVASKSNTKFGTFTVNRVKSLSGFDSISSHSIGQSAKKNFAIELKAFLVESETADLLHRLSNEVNSVLYYCDSSPGIVTAANDFFILSSQDVERHNLSPWARRILKKSSFLPRELILDSNDFELISEKEPCYLIDFVNSKKRQLTSSAKKYIEEGENQGLHNRFKCRHRKPWYKVPILPASEGLFFKRAHFRPKLCINEANVLVTDTAYQIRMHPGYSIQGLCFSFYNSMTMLFAEIYGRFYAGGVLELTPGEFRALPVSYRQPSEIEFAAFIKNFTNEQISRDEQLKFGDIWLKKELQLSTKQMNQIQIALTTLRGHRLRHGGSVMINSPSEVLEI